MALKPPPDLMHLKSILLTSRLQQSNQPLFHVINQLIDFLNKRFGIIEDALEDTIAGDFLTHKDDSATLPSSKELMPGQGIAFRDEKNRRWVDAAYPIPADGEQGEDGTIGVTGPPGTTGAAGSPGAQGVPGPAIFGIDGIDGEDGLPGTPGPQGFAGTTGVQGATGIGTPGLDGEDGENSYIPGPQGLQGIQGPVGPSGSGSGGAAMPLPLESVDDDVESFPVAVFNKANLGRHIVRMIPTLTNLGSTPSWRGTATTSVGAGVLDLNSFIAVMQMEGYQNYIGKGIRNDEAEMDHVHFLVKTFDVVTGNINLTWTTEQRYTLESPVKLQEFFGVTAGVLTRVRATSGLRRAGYVKGNFSLWVFVSNNLNTLFPLGN